MSLSAEELARKFARIKPKPSVMINRAPADAAMVEGHERTILAYLMNGRDGCCQFLHRVDEHMFSIPNRGIVHAVRDVFNEGDKVNLVTVSERLKEMRRLQECGGPARITAISIETTSEEIAESALECVLDNYRARKAAEIGKQLCSHDIALEDARKQLDDIITSQGPNGEYP